MLSSVVTGDTVEDGGREISIGDRNNKKARFKGLDCDMENDIVVDSFPASKISWRDKVLGRRVPDSSREEDFKLLDGDVTRSTVNVKFQSRVDYDKVLTQGHWIVFGEYITVQSWTLEFDLLWAFPSNAMVWVRLLGLPGFIYKRQFLEKIGGLIGMVIKLDFQKDNGLRGKFTRVAVSINLIKPLVSQIMVNGAM
ncbi:hypothetical protein Goari_018089 [Gossypium aridum]|uniref:DUF4283 domain-containing protein n=1 Tax=Gossypium aridum TaxID=34290 RepID=A0A7J8WNJ1_GOSAI|nr:hypothetical protein [Gossypium aridum]